MYAQAEGTGGEQRAEGDSDSDKDDELRNAFFVWFESDTRSDRDVDMLTRVAKD